MLAYTFQTPRCQCPPHTFFPSRGHQRSQVLIHIDSPVMDADPANLRTMSLHLSRTLDEIGLNSLTVKRSRKTHLVIEQMWSWEHRINGLDCTVYHFGSQSEGATTRGLDSDLDHLSCFGAFNVIQSLGEWKQDSENLLMLQENTEPGYCRLQLLDPDIPMARDDSPDKYFTYDDRGRVIVKNTCFIGQDCRYRNGPAITSSVHGFIGRDIVGAFRCNSWPAQAEEFTRRPRRHGWPSEHLLQEAVQHGVFLVGVGHKLSPPEVELLEWRISASMAERCLMFSLSIVHIKCYVVLKMLVKTFVEPHVRKCISSYHCKTALFHCTENTEARFWRDDNLIQCVVRCLELLFAWVSDCFCPNFIIHEDNLFVRKVSVHNRGVLQSIIKDLITRNGHAILQIQIDDLGQRLWTNLSTDPVDMPVLDPPSPTVINIGYSEYCLQSRIAQTVKNILLKHISKEPVTLIHVVCKQAELLKVRLRQSDKHERQAIQVLIDFLSCWLGSLRASVELYENRKIPQDVLQLLPNGTNIDVASMLKLASILYCNGDLRKVKTILQNVEIHFSSHKTLILCGCYSTRAVPTSLDFLNAVYALKGMKARAQLFAHCVIFTPQEMHCAPPVLRVEFYRAVGDDAQHRDPERDGWMDLSVVDCLPYLYFLQYLTARQLDKQDLQSRSLQNLARCVREDHSFHHLETALNLLGQCYEHELKPDAAMACYRTSLGIRPRNNAAKWHIATLCYRLVQQK